MSGEEEPVAWLRAAITARLELAREASERTDGHWWRRMADAGHFDGGALEPVGALYAGEPVLDADGEVSGGEEVVVYDEGRPSDVQFDHIAANDPQDTIARCEAELAILDEHASVADYPPESIAEHRARGWPEYQLTMMAAMVNCDRCHAWVDDAREDEDQCKSVGYPCRSVRLLASGYRHAPGYREEDWKP